MYKTPQVSRRSLLQAGLVFLSAGNFVHELLQRLGGKRAAATEDWRIERSWVLANTRAVTGCKYAPDASGHALLQYHGPLPLAKDVRGLPPADRVLFRVDTSDLPPDAVSPHLLAAPEIPFTLTRINWEEMRAGDLVYMQDTDSRGRLLKAELWIPSLINGRMATVDKELHIWHEPT